MSSTEKGAAQAASTVAGATTIFMGVQALSSFKFGADVWMMMNTIQIARTTTLIS
jgi:hypothetical protein